MQARQGDVLILKVNDFDEKEVTEVPQDNGRTVLAYGEVTGHAHALEKGKLYRRDPLTQYLFLGDKAEVRHEEHGGISLPPGKYEVRQQRQWTLEQVRRVAD